jgi:hypothetical protein
LLEAEVDVEVVTLERDPLLSPDEAETFSHLEQELLQPRNDRGLEIVLLPSRSVGEI